MDETTRWSRGSGRPTPEGPPAMASAAVRAAWSEAGAALVRGAAAYSLDRLRTSQHSAPPELRSPHPGIEIRPATYWTVFGNGERAGNRADLFAADVVAVLRERGIQDERIGVDRLDAYGFLALQAAGVHLVAVQLAVERARTVKGPAEITLIRRSVGICDAAVAALRDALRPGMTENEAWAPHRPGRSRGRPLPHLPRRVHDAVRARQRRLHADASAFLAAVIAELKPGAALDEVGERLRHRLPAEYHAERYPLIAHGCGLADEYPVLSFTDHHPGELEAGTVLSAEAYMGVEGEDEGLKLEEQGPRHAQGRGDPQPGPVRRPPRRPSMTAPTTITALVPAAPSAEEHSS